MTSREQRRQLWAARIADYRASGLTMSAWCAANHCTIDQLKYWLYKAKNLPSSPSSAIPHPLGAAYSCRSAIRNLTLRPLWWFALEKPGSNFRPVSTPGCSAKSFGRWGSIMLTLSGVQRVYLACGSTDLRKSIDSSGRARSGKLRPGPVLAVPVRVLQPRAQQAQDPVLGAQRLLAVLPPSRTRDISMANGQRRNAHRLQPPTSLAARRTCAEPAAGASKVTAETVI